MQCYLLDGSLDLGDILSLREAADLRFVRVGTVVSEPLVTYAPAKPNPAVNAEFQRSCPSVDKSWIDAGNTSEESVGSEIIDGSITHLTRENLDDELV